MTYKNAVKNSVGTEYGVLYGVNRSFLLAKALHLFVMEESVLSMHAI